VLTLRQIHDQVDLYFDKYTPVGADIPAPISKEYFRRQNESMQMFWNLDGDALAERFSENMSQLGHILVTEWNVLSGWWDGGVVGLLNGATELYTMGGAVPIYNYRIAMILRRQRDMLVDIELGNLDAYSEIAPGALEQYTRYMNIRWSNLKSAIDQYESGNMAIHFSGGNVGGYEVARKTQLYNITDKVKNKEPLTTYDRTYLGWTLDANRKRFDLNHGNFTLEEQNVDVDFTGEIKELIWEILQSDGDLSQLLVSPTIQFVVDKLFDYDTAKRKITNKVNDMMQSLTYTPIIIPNEYWGTGARGDDNEIIIRPRVFPKGGPGEKAAWYIGSKYITRPERIETWRLTSTSIPGGAMDPEGNITSTLEFDKGHLMKQGMAFPGDYKGSTSGPVDSGGADGTGSSGNNIDPVWASMKKSLQSFNSFAGDKDITEYTFEYNTSVNQPHSHREGTFGFANETWLELFSGEDFEDRKSAVITSLDDSMKINYVAFIMKVFKDWELNGRLDQTIGTIFNSQFNDLNVKADFYQPIMIDKEMSRRVAYWRELARLANALIYDASLGSDQDRVSDEDLDKALIKANDTFLEGELPKIEPLDDETLEERRKFFKQCALMMNAHLLKNQLLGVLKTQATESKMVPFGGRFWMARCDENQERLINNLIASEDGAAFFDIPPYVMSYLLPKIRLYRVENTTKGQLTETEFIFDQSTDVDRERNYTRSSHSPYVPENFLSADFDKGDGCGLKEFSFEYKGTTPAESRNDLTAKLTLFFQSFGDFVRERVGSNGKTYRYVDLVLQPTENQAKALGIEVVHPQQYDPAFFRIRAEVGYNVPDNLDTAFSQYDSTLLRRAISRTNRSMYLVMVDHDININNDGTVEITINYRAYVETALKSLRFDALATPALIKDRHMAEKKLYELLTDGTCSKEDINEFKAASAGKEEEHRQKSLQSIMKRLLKSNKIYVTQIRHQDATHFRKNGYFNECILQDLHTGAPLDATKFTPDMALEEGEEQGAVAFALRNNLPEDGDFDYTDTTDTTIQYFFFGDLLYTIMDTMYDEESSSLVSGMENTRIILGSLDFDPYTSFSADVTINIAQLPISADFFMKWFTDNVLVKGETRKSFPILSFIRNLSSTLVEDSLLEACVNKKMKKTTKFLTGQISAYADKIDVDPFGKFVVPNGKEVVVNTDIHLGDGLPMKGDAENEIRDPVPAKANHFYNYLVLSAVGSSLTFTGNGNYADDIAKGRYHVNIGSDRGIVKTVSFAKTDMQYAREARFMQQGIDGLMQLSVVYNATIEMFGNTLFYPGMELFINPYGIGGTALGSPTQGPNHTGGRSLANKLGLGGYHTITNVKSSITPGKYTTSLQAQQYYSGDGQGNPNLAGQAAGKKETGEFDSLTVTREGQTDEQAEKCNNAILQVINGELNVTPTGGTEASIEGISDTEVNDVDENTIVTSTSLDGSVYSGSFIDDNGKELVWEYDRRGQPVATASGTTTQYTLQGITIAEEEVFNNHPEQGDSSVRLSLTKDGGIYWSTLISAENAATGDEEHGSVGHDLIENDDEEDYGTDPVEEQEPIIDDEEEEEEETQEEDAPTMSPDVQAAEEKYPTDLFVVYRADGDIWAKVNYNNATSDDYIKYHPTQSVSAQRLIDSYKSLGIPVIESDEGIENADYQRWVTLERESRALDPMDQLDFWIDLGVSSITSKQESRVISGVAEVIGVITVTYNNGTVEEITEK